MAKAKRSTIYVSSQFQLGTSPPRQPPGKCFWASESRPPGKFFLCLIPCPGVKMMVEFSGMGQNFPKLEETAPKACKKFLRKLRDSINFLFGELNKTFIF